MKKIAVAVIVFTMVTAAVVFAAESGEDLFYSKCTPCNSSSLSLGKKKDEILWKATIKRMKKHGASISSSDTDAIANFLSGGK